MREIIFRGKDIAGNWYYGVPLVFTEDYVCMTAPHTYNKSVIPESVGQYTGLRDCKRTEEYPEGQMIFEGDIVITNKFGTPQKKYVIGFDEEIATYIGEGKKGCARYFTTFSGDADCFEVIGNIHDNPELLKGEQNDRA